ncbi:MAG: hypothetical protein MJ252_11185 [archaeon]|nr:hypothetical protein [archaeon]
MNIKNIGNNNDKFVKYFQLLLDPQINQETIGEDKNKHQTERRLQTDCLATPYAKRKAVVSKYKKNKETNQNNTDDNKIVNISVCNITNDEIDKKTQIETPEKGIGLIQSKQNKKKNNPNQNNLTKKEEIKNKGNQITQSNQRQQITQENQTKNIKINNKEKPSIHPEKIKETPKPKETSSLDKKVIMGYNSKIKGTPKENKEMHSIFASKKKLDPDTPAQLSTIKSIKIIGNISHRKITNPNKYKIKGQLTAKKLPEKNSGFISSNKNSFKKSNFSYYQTQITKLSKKTKETDKIKAVPSLKNKVFFMQKVGIGKHNSLNLPKTANNNISNSSRLEASTLKEKNSFIERRPYQTMTSLTERKAITAKIKNSHPLILNRAVNFSPIKFQSAQSKITVTRNPNQIKVVKNNYNGKRGFKSYINGKEKFKSLQIRPIISSRNSSFKSQK